MQSKAIYYMFTFPRIDRVGGNACGRYVMGICQSVGALEVADSLHLVEDGKGTLVLLAAHLPTAKQAHRQYKHVSPTLLTVVAAYARMVYAHMVDY